MVTLTAVALIALVIGGNTTIYSMVHAVLAKPAPGVRADRLVTLQRRVDGRGVGPEHPFPDYVEYARQTTTLAPLLGMQWQRFSVGIGDGVYVFSGGLASGSYFETLGVHLARGRTFTAADQESPEVVAVISDRIWRTQLGGADDVVGRSITLNGHAATIVGVAPPDFHGAWLGEGPDVWTPLLPYHRRRGTVRTLIDGSSAPLQVIGRLAPGASLSSARAEFDTITSRLQAAYPETHRNRSVGVLPYSMTSGGDSLVAEQAPRFLAIFSIVTALTLAIVCANVANLMLGRAVLRQRELAVRQTLGASRGRILRTLLAEGGVIAAASWVAACVFALVVSKGVIHLAPQSPQGVTLVLDLTPDWQVIAYAFGLAVVGTLAFTVAPAIRAWKQELLPSLRSGELGVVAGRSTLSTGLVVMQMAFAVLLLTSAGLAYRSLSMLGSMDAGFPRDHLLLAGADTAEAAATPDARMILLERLRERLRAVPGIQSVSYVQSWEPTLVRATASQQPLAATAVTVGPDYFATLGMALRSGQTFDGGASDIAAPAALITQSLADALWPGESPIGRTFQAGRRDGPVAVAGVVPNGVFNRFQRDPKAHYVFRPLRPELIRRGETFISFYVRYAGARDAISPAIGRAFREIDPRAPLISQRTMEDELDDFASAVRIVTIWMTLFAVGSLAIAAIGQYAVIAFDMRRRTRDFGVRIALGASAQQILGSVLAQGFRWTAAGLLIGFALSLAAGRAFRSLLVGTTPTDARTYAGVFLLLAAASLLACYLPARRASRIDPIQALRQE